MILQVPFQWWLHEQPFDYYRYTSYGLKYLFEKAGFKVIEISPTGGFFTMWFLKLNYFLLRFYRKKFFFLIPMIEIVWFINQKLAPILDRLDRNPHLESPGFFVVALKE